MEEPNVASMELIELSKENIMPLPTGRRATVLQAVLTGGAKHDGSQSTSAGHLMAPGADGAGARGAVSGVAPKTPQRPGAASGTVSNPVSPQQNPDPDMERQRLEFERQVTDPALLDSDDDPLEIHYRYVRWLLEHYTTGHNASSRTLNVLERTLETFKRDGRYKNDPRHLRLWLTYKDMVRDPLDVFRWLHTNDILQELAGFYEGWAGCLESKGRYKDADAMYQLGIHRRAQPLERLQRRYMEFQRRMMTTTAPPDEEPSLDENPIQRTALAPTGSRTAVSTNENVRAGNATARPPSSGRATQVQAVPAQPQPQTKPGKMAIFSDPEGSAARPAQQGTWSELGTQQQRNRENLREKEKWTDVRVPSAAPAPVGKIQVWTDDLDSLKPQAHPVSANSAILREKPVTAVEAHHGLLSSAEEVSEEPAPTPVPVPAAAAPPSRPSSAGPSGPSSSRPAGSKTASSKKAAAPAAPQPVVGERPAVSFHLVYPSSAGVSFADAASGAKKCEEEKSFEEIRAERKYGLLGYVSESEPDSGGEEEEEEEPAEVFNRTTGSRHFDAVVPIGDDGKLDATVTLSFRDKRKSVASPTINTKKAMSDVYAMFSGDLDEDDQDYYAQPEEDDTRPVLVFEQPSKKVPIFQDSDENAPPPASSSKMAIFRDSEPPAAPPPKPKLSIFSDATAPPPGQAGKTKLAVFADATEPAPSSSAGLKPREALGARSIGPMPSSSSSAKPPMAVRSILKPAGGRRSFDEDDEGNPFAPRSDSPNDGDSDTIPGESGTGQSLRPSKKSSLTQREVRGLVREVVEGAEEDEGQQQAWNAIEDPRERLALERERIFEQQQMQAIQSGGVMVPLGPRLPDLPTLYDPALTPITERTEPSSRATCTTAANSSLALSSSALSATSGRPSFIPHERTFAHDHGDNTSTLSLTKVLKGNMNNQILEEDELAELDTATKRLDISGPYNPFLDEPMKRYVSACVDADSRTLVRHDGQLLQRGLKFAPSSEIPIQETAETLIVERKIGEGGYGVVWLATNVDANVEDDGSDGSDDDYGTGRFSLRMDRDPIRGSFSSSLARGGSKKPRGSRSVRAVKVANSKSKIVNLTYEHCMLRTARDRLVTSSIAACLINVYDCHVFSDTAFLRMEFSAGGTLLDIVNVAMTSDSFTSHISAGQGAGMDEVLAIFYAIEVLKIVDALHGVDMVHGDIKPENFLARWGKPGSKSADNDADNTRNSVKQLVPDEWTSIYDATGGGGWEDRGLTIVDFGRALDIRGASKDRERNYFTDFDLSGKGDPAVECWELRNKQPFHGFELDWYGIAGVVHVLLFGKFMEISEGQPGSAGLDERKPEITIATLHAMKRYWQTDEIWIPLFSTLLNPPRPYATAGREAVQNITRRMQKWLELNCQKGTKNLRASLKKLELAVMEKANKKAAQMAKVGAGPGPGRGGLPLFRK